MKIWHVCSTTDVANITENIINELTVIIVFEPEVQELHHGLVAFCSELKNMEGETSVERLGAAELKQKLELVKCRLNDKRQSLQTLRDHINNSAAHKKK